MWTENRWTAGASPLKFTLISEHWNGELFWRGGKARARARYIINIRTLGFLHKSNLNVILAIVVSRLRTVSGHLEPISRRWGGRYHDLRKIDGGRWLTYEYTRGVEYDTRMKFRTPQHFHAIYKWPHRLSTVAHEQGPSRGRSTYGMIGAQSPASSSTSPRAQAKNGNTRCVWPKPAIVRSRYKICAVKVMGTVRNAQSAVFPSLLAASE